MVLSFSDPYTLLMECGEERPIGEKRLYILDIHLSTEMNGIRLAQEIRRFDSQGDLIFITTDGEQMPLAFRLQLKALDYIVKDQEDNLKEAFSRCIEKVLKLEATQQRYFVIETSGSFYRYPFHDIMFICTNGKKGILEMHTRSSLDEFRGTLKQILISYPDLLQIHQGILVNSRNVIKIDERNRILTMSNGEKCEIAYRFRRKIFEKIKKQLI